MLLARCSFGIFCRAVNPSFAQRGAALLVIKGVHERQNSCVFTCFATLMYTFCCGTPFAAMYLCCGAPVTARSSCSRVPWLPLQPIQSCPRAAFGYNAWCFVPLAQWIRASASGAEGRRFESCKGHQIGQPGLLHAARVFLYESLGAPSQRFAITGFLRISAVGMRWLCLMLCLFALCTGHTMAR